MFAQLTELLFDVLFDPSKGWRGLISVGGLPTGTAPNAGDAGRRVQRQMTYAHRRCEELLFQGQRAEVGRCGTREDVGGLRPTPGYCRLAGALKAPELKSLPWAAAARTQSCSAPVFPAWEARSPSGCLPTRSRGRSAGWWRSSPSLSIEAVHGLPGGLRAGRKRLFQLMAAVLGGVPSSKLFQNVREK